MPENPSNDTTTAEVKSQDNQFMQAAIKVDAATLENVMSDDYVFISGMGRRMSKKEHLDSLKSGDIRYKSLTYNDIKVRVYGDTAVLTGHIRGEGTNGGESISGEHLITRVYVKQGGCWKIVSAQATRAAQ